MELNEIDLMELLGLPRRAQLVLALTPAETGTDRPFIIARSDPGFIYCPFCSLSPSFFPIFIFERLVLLGTASPAVAGRSAMNFDIEIRVMHTSRVSAKAALIGIGVPNH